MAERMIRMPLRLAQDMANVLKQLPYAQVADVLNELAGIQAEPPLESVIKSDQGDSTPEEKEASPAA